MSPGRRRLAAIMLVLAAVAVVAAPAVAKRLVHPRDPEAYYRYVTTYVGGWRSSKDPNGYKRDKAWVARHRQDVITEGDRVCSWLADRPDAPTVDPTGQSSMHTLMTQYVGESRKATGLSEYGHSTLVAGAWNYLCWWERRAKTAPVDLAPY